MPQVLRRDISACDDCGLCCQTPCLIGSPDELPVISAAVGRDIRHSLSVERTPAGDMLVRVSRQSPCEFWNGRCTLQAVKPKGGREFECWTPATFALTYHWSPADLAAAGIRVRD